MTITFLGTGAGEKYPCPWCECENCSYARAHGGKNLRGHSSILIDDDLMIDLTESGIQRANEMGIYLGRLRYLLVTHAHSDHFDPFQLWSRFFPPALKGLPNEEIANRHSSPRTTAVEDLEIYANTHVWQAILGAEVLARPHDDYSFDFHTIRGGDQFNIGGTEITAISSHHVSEDYTLNYIIKREGRTILYALDAGGYSPEMWKQVTAQRYDCVIVEATGGLITGESPGHMTLEKVRSFFADLRISGSVSSESRLVLSHMSPHWTPPHDELQPLMEKEGIDVAYDGKTITY